MRKVLIAALVFASAITSANACDCVNVPYKPPSKAQIARDYKKCLQKESKDFCDDLRTLDQGGSITTHADGTTTRSK